MSVTVKKKLSVSQFFSPIGVVIELDDQEMDVTFTAESVQEINGSTAIVLLTVSINEGANTNSYTIPFDFADRDKILDEVEEHIKNTEA
ncbi:hypothetical protein JHU04_002520 [Brenneria sp. 4F2]|nr:hypothetical protein [Brenneria bubanii]